MASNNKPTGKPVYKISNGKLIIELPYDNKATYPMSGSGKNQMVGSSKGFQTFEDLRISINVIK